MSGVILGMPGPWADSNYEAADMYTSKIGGIPDWPFPNVGEKPDLLKCSTCRSDLCLLAQVYAPISNKSATIDGRVIYIFGCLVPDCESLHWRALRVQRISTNEIVNGDTQPLSISDNNKQVDPWSFDISKEDDEDLDELTRACSEAANITSNAKKERHYAVVTEKPTRDQPVRSVDDKTPVIPCFYLYTQEEKRSKKAASEDSKYPLPSVLQLDGNLADNPNEETYEEEMYEYDRALYADRTYLKFKKRMEAYPEQCFRYSYGGKPLLPSGGMRDPGNCEICGGTRHYEMQLMPPLIYFLQEAADDHQRSYLEKVDWMTLLIFTCSLSCSDKSSPVKFGSDNWIVAVEAVIIQQERIIR